MVYSTGQTIVASDYNGFVASVNAIWGGGSLTRGYGQNNTLGTVSGAPSGTTITAQQWIDLINKMNSVRGHQVNAGTGVTAPSASTTISPISGLTTAIGTIDSNRFGNYAWQGTTSNFNPNGTTWTGVSTKECSITFNGGAAAMRYFFNSGGAIQTYLYSSSITTGVNLKSNDWDTFLRTQVGGVNIWATYSENYSASASGAQSMNNNLGFYAASDTGIGSSTGLTSSYQQVLLHYSPTTTGGYTSNYAQLYARLNANANTNAASVLYLLWYLVDGSADNSIPATQDYVYGTTRADFVVYLPENAYVNSPASPWGTITINANLTNTQG